MVTPYSDYTLCSALLKSSSGLFALLLLNSQVCSCIKVYELPLVGETLRLKVCNNLSAFEPDAIGALNDTFATYIQPMEVNAFPDLSLHFIAA